jgi:L-lactate dehydrogenase complex protein LldG
MLSLRPGRAEAGDQVAITGAFGGIAETGTLVMASGPDHPVTLNLLPDTHIVVLRESDIVGGYEDVWARLRARYGKDRMPRSVNTITGPSRTGDIEQTIELGAHGPRRMHILVVHE